MLAIIILVIINIMIFMNISTKSHEKKSSEWTVYGTIGCGWTRKQLEYMKNKGITYTFVECDKDAGCSGIEAFPTMIHESGEKVVGFREV